MPTDPKSLLLQTMDEVQGEADEFMRRIDGAIAAAGPPPHGPIVQAMLGALEGRYGARVKDRQQFWSTQAAEAIREIAAKELTRIINEILREWADADYD